MTLSETQIDKFCQSPLGLHLPSNHPSEATTPILGTLTPAFLASLSAWFTAETPSTPRRIREKRQTGKNYSSAQTFRISFLVLITTPAARRSKASLFLGLLGVSAVE
jgi:hypothetical protein